MIIGLLGNLGKGKTLGTTFLGVYYLNNLHIDHLICNYQVDGMTQYVSNPEELDKATKEHKENGTPFILLLDEVWAWMESRKSQQNDTMIEIVLNSRKRGGIVIWNSQKTHLVDKVLVENTDYWGVPNHFEAWELDLDHDMAEIQMIENGNMMKLGRKFEFNPEPYYDVYDTTEEVSRASEGDMYEDLIKEKKKEVKQGVFETKKQLSSHLTVREDLSKAKAERLTDEIFREVDLERKNQSGQQTLEA